MKQRPRIILMVVGMLLTYCFGCGPCSQSQPANGRNPRLVVVLVIDQFRYDYLVRFSGLFSGGLATLARDGLLFTNAHQRQAITACAPGHAALLTGCYPAQHGLIGDTWYDRTRRRLVSCIEDSSYTTVTPFNKSPRQNLRATLGDWMKAQDSVAKVLSIAGTDLAAILMGGQSAEAAFWFDTTSGTFTTSPYYSSELPQWAEQWNRAKPADRYFDTAWEKLLPETEYFLSREDLFAAEADGIHTTFPHRLNEDGEIIGPSFYQRLAASPFGDLLTLEFAQTAVSAMQLGKDDHTDLLCLGLSATQALGQAYGPLSQELQDHLLRLDLNLGKFLEGLEQEIGREQLLVALASDHGVLPLPEELRRRGFEAARVNADEVREEIAGALEELRAPMDSTAGAALVEYLHNGLYLVKEQAESQQTPLAEKMRSLSFVADIFTANELASPALNSREYEEEFRHAYFAGRSPEILFRRKPYYLIWNHSPYGTASGSTYDYDTHIPLLLWGADLKSARNAMPCSAVDLAPTLAHLLGVRVPEGIAGKVLPLNTPTLP